MDASEPKCVNSDGIIYGVNSQRPSNILSLRF